MPPVEPGGNFGPYHIVALLGAGAMGRVYRARDTRLNREVALKVLPDSLASDRERIERFEREAAVLASLDHPNIAAIYGIEVVDGTTALILQLVEGETLAARIARGPLPIDEALPVATQIAEALEAAHGRGVIHRDLKPSNIALARNGQVKLLDFGLAKVIGSSPAPVGDLSHSPTVISPTITGAGVILGTAAYMSPEQARGKPVDTRADIWAFGLVLYEMLVGRHAFHGESVSEVVASVIKDRPDFRALPPDVPLSVKRLLQRCLEKDPRRRLRDIGDALFELTEPAIQDGNTPTGVRALMWMIATVVAGLLAAAGWSRPVANATTATPYVLTIVPAAGSQMRIRQFSSLEISPDGTMVLFVTRGGLYVRPLRSLSAIRIPGSERIADQAFWAPGSDAVVFATTDRTLVRVRVPDGAPQRLTTLPGPSRGGTWSDSGTILIATTQLLSIPATGGEPTVVKTPDGPCAYPQFLPEGDDFLCFSPLSDGSGENVYLATLRNGEAANPVPLMRLDTAPRYTPAGGGRLMFVRNDNLYWQSLNRRARTMAGEEQLALASVSSQPQRFLAHFSVSRSGTIAWRPGRAELAQVTTFDRSGARVGTSGPLAALSSVVASPDDTRLLAGDEVRDWLLDVGLPGRIVLDSRAHWFDWSVDGGSIIGMELANGTLLRRTIDGAGELLEQRRVPELAGLLPQDLSRDGTTMLLMRPGLRGLFEFDVDTVAAPVKLKSVLDEGVPAFDARFSPDGRWIVYATVEAGRSSLFVQPRTGSLRRRQIASAGMDPEWRADGREIVYIGSGADSCEQGCAVWSVAVSAMRDELRFGTPVLLFSDVRMTPASVPIRRLAVSADGSRLYVAEAVEQPDPAIHVTNGWLANER